MAYKSREVALAKRKEWRAKNKDRLNADQKSRRLEKIEFYREYHREWRKNHPENWHKKHIKNTFRISSEEYDRIFGSHNGLCDICGKPETSTYRGKLRRLSLDHCHSTGAIRGVVCNSCNLGLERFNDNPKTILSAWMYLQNSKEAAA